MTAAGARDVTAGLLGAGVEAPAGNRPARRELTQRLLDDEMESNEERQRDDAGCPYDLG
jgi:hypothetical protein